MPKNVAVHTTHNVPTMNTAIRMLMGSFMKAPFHHLKHVEDIVYPPGDILVMVGLSQQD
jgi:hypothetical protein